MPKAAVDNLTQAEALGIDGNADEKDKSDLKTALRIEIIKEYEIFKSNNPGQQITPGVAVTEQVRITTIHIASIQSYKTQMATAN